MFFLRAILIFTRHYPFVRGRDWFYRNFVRGTWISRAIEGIRNPVIARRGFAIYCNPADLTSDWIKVWGEHETATESFLLENLRKGGAFLDVGANVGYFSLLVGHELGKSIDVVAFEPNPEIATLLESGCNASRAIRRPRVVRKAVSDEPGKMGLSIDRENTGHGKLTDQTHNGEPAIEVVRLDDWLEREAAALRISAVKLDVEGCEMRALRGMKDMLLRDKPALVVEVIDSHLAQFGSSQAEVEGFLLDIGYRRLEIRHAGDNQYYVA